jgi:hypothetical protein
MTDDQRERGRGPFVGCLAIGFMLGLPAYVLSVGPAGLIFGPPPFPDWLRLIYYPLGTLCDLSPTFNAWIGWYITLWTG